MSRKNWRCFHCDENFTDRKAAADHFGTSIFQEPACQIDAKKYREMENQVRRANEDDSDTDRRMYAMQGEHQVALRREEEKGYARGLKDANYLGQDTDRLDWLSSNPQRVTHAIGFRGDGDTWVWKTAAGYGEDAANLRDAIDKAKSDKKPKPPVEDQSDDYCTECHRRDCNGECMGDGLMGG